jgi:hypothetical protein
MTFPILEKGIEMKILSKLVVLVALSVSVVQCKTNSGAEDSSAKERDSSADPLGEPMGLRVNLDSNMATFFENGVAIKKWKVASARNDGRSATPTGKFRFHEMTTCVRWTSTRNGASAGPCAADNPLGFRALWFNSSTFGLHGVDSAHISSVTSESAESRRQSSGCVRNHPENIKWLTEKVSALYGTNPAELQRRVSAGMETSLRPIGKGLALEIGNFGITDVALGAAPNGVVRPAGPAVPAPFAPTPAVNTGDLPGHGAPSTTKLTLEQVKAACKLDSASGFIKNTGELPVLSFVDKPGSPVIGKTKPFEIMCPTENVLNGQTQVYFPLPPAGFGWVDSQSVVTGCGPTPGVGYATLNECLANELDPSSCDVLMCQKE